MTRRELRTKSFLLLYRTFFYTPEKMEEQKELFVEEIQEKASKEDIDFILNRVDSVMGKLEEIDAVIEEKAVNWNINRIDYIDLTIIRQAYYEIKYVEDVPTAVAINEAVDIAKIYGSQDSYSFVNGILAKMI